MTTHRCRYRFLDRFHRRVSLLFSPVVLAAFLSLAVLPPRAVALPVGGQVVVGRVNVTVNGPQLTLDQASRAAVMNWQQFNIAPNELVRILQSSPEAALLARVTGGDPSRLLGSLKADGKLFLINPKGILVGQGAMIDTAAFMASTLDVADADFLQQGALTFRGDSTAGVVNLGKITAREGNVLLLAHTVRNAGEISAPHGTAGLGAGTEVYLASPDAPLFVIRTNLPVAAAETGVDNSGVIAAAQAQLEAAGGSIYDLAVNHSGTIQATGVERRPDGRILITAGGGNVSVGGAAAARKADGSGGEILVGGDYQGKNAAVANAAHTRVAAGALLDADAGSAGGDGGRVIVWADGTTRFDGAISARAGDAGGNGGFAEVSGKRALAFTGTSDLSAVAGQRGTLLLDPDNITIVAGSTPPPAGIENGPPVVWHDNVDPGSHDFGADNLVSLLANNSVHLLATDTITVDAPVVVAAGGTPGMELSFSASTIAVNQTVSLANVTNGRLSFSHGGSAAGTSLTTAAGATIAAARIRAGGFPITTLNGPVATAKLVFDGFDTQTSFTATNPANAIATFILNTDEADPQAVDFSGNVSVHSSTALGVSAMIGAANNVTFSSAGNLTMRNDGAEVSTIAASGTTKLASTGGVLVNEVGPALLAGTGRQLLYTSTTASGSGFDLGGLTGFTRYSGVTFPNDPQSGAARALYRADGLVTITADAKSRTYGAADPTFTASYAGGAADDLTTLPSFSIQEGAPVNAGAYTIVPAGAADDYYDFAYVNGTLTVNPATLTYTATPASRLNIAADPAFSGTVTGFVNGDTQAGATTGTLAFSTTATSSSPAGSYAINGSGLTANFGNYVFVQAPGNATAFTINPAALLTITANSFLRFYGESDPVFTASYAGGTAGDLTTLPSFSIQEGAHVNVGTYTIVPSGAASVTHELGYVNGTLTIDPATLTYVAHAASRTTAGTNPAFSGTVTGFVNGDTQAGATTGTLAFSTTATDAGPAGSYAINGSGLSANFGNYVFAQAPGNATAFTVTQAGLLVITANSFLRFYGEPDPVFTAAYAGGTASDLTTLPSFSIQEGAHANVGTYTIVPAGAASSTHTLNYVNGTLRIDPVTLTYTAHAASRTVGDANPAFSGTVTGFVNGDTQAGATTGTLAFSSAATAGSPAGSYAINGSGLTANFGNYVFAQAPGNATAFTINPAALLTITANDFIKFYGQSDPTFTASYAGGTVADLTTLPSFSIQEGAHVNVGTYTIVPAGAASSTHALSYVNGTLTVDPATLTYTAHAASRNAGGADPAFSGTVTGFVNGDTQAGATTGTLAFNTTATGSSPAGSYAINGSGLTANFGNYVFVQAPGNTTAFTINPAALLTITANDFIKLYGQPDPTFTASYAGGTAADLTVLPSFSIQGGAHVNTGTYAIVPAGAASSTHTLNYVNGTLRIDPVTLTYVANSASRTYGDANPVFSGTVTGFVNGDTQASATTGALVFTSPTTAASNAGSHAINGGGLTASFGNYLFEDAVANFSALTVNQAPLTVTFGNAARAYGAANPEFAASFAGFRNGDTAAALAGFSSGTTARTDSPVGTYLIGGGATARNYALTVVPGTLTVTPAPLTLTVNPATMTYGNALPAFTYTLGGLLNGDQTSVLSGVQFNIVLFSSSAPGTYAISPTGLGTAQNYQVTTVVPGTLTMNRRPVTVAADNVSTYVGLMPTLTTSANGGPVAGGPQFSFGVSVGQTTFNGQGVLQFSPVTLTNRSPAGIYSLAPTIVPGPLTSLAEIERFYAFTTFNGTLTLTEPPVGMVILTQTFDPNQQVIVTTNMNFSDFKEEFDKKIQSIDFTDTTPKITVGHMGDQLTVKQWSNVVLDSGDAIIAGLKAQVGTYDTGRKDAKGNPILGPRLDNTKYSEKEMQILADVWSGKLTLAQLAERMGTDDIVRNLVMPLIAKDLTDAVASGKPMTQAQEILAARVAKKMNEQRAILKTELAEAHAEYMEAKIAAGTNNPFALKTMPDIATSAQQAAMEQLIGAAIGSVGGVAAGSGAAALITIPAVAEAIFPNAAAAVSVAGGAAAGAAAAIVAAVVIGVVAGVMVAQEQANINAYDVAVKRANAPVSVNLSNVDLKGDDVVKSEYYAAFMATMLETKFP